ncbi:MAG: hypothetical protein ACU0CC_12935 [Sagittula sp.]|jgi:hypothetical protein|uniref:hypothetical protein n=1 Tax=unclassified Sagittula TaxID=2624628 RepID=UPI000C2CF896|nr:MULTISPECIES: hypothetical protein [unclassified Sagittula]AUC54735.1 hypothetical protein CDO87_16825 [Sagittula sp. P11]WHZ33907.1 hypothetical protein QNI11_14820 [Sagittula sp. MA-2]
MYKRILDIVLCSTVVLGFSSGAVASLTRADMHALSDYMIASSGFTCVEVKAVAPTPAEHVYRVSCDNGAGKQVYVINARTGEVWRT